jgi:cell division protein FtsL
MIRPGTVIWLLLIVIVGFTLFQVKYEVMQQEETLAKLNAQITEGRERLRVLDAEWAYLTRPDRLNRLAARYLDLQPMSAAQIVDLAAIPERADAPTPLVRNATAVRSRSGAPADPVTVATEPHFAKAATGIQP